MSVISLKNFFIYNSTLSTKEGDEEKKILFYHPPDYPIDNKSRDVGLSEAIVKFTNLFSGDESTYSFHTLKNVQLFYQAEPEFWMAMTVNAPYDKKTRDGVEYKEYKGDDVHDKIYGAVLRQSYSMFRLFYGTFLDNFVGDSTEERSLALMGKFEDFFSEYIKKLCLPNCDILTAIKSVQYMSLDQKLFLRIHNFTNSLESTHPMIKHCVYLYKDRVVWSGLSPQYLYTLNEYLLQKLLPTLNEDSLFRPALGFLVEPDHRGHSKSVPVFMYNDSGRVQYQLAVYAAHNVICCMFIGKDPTAENYQELESIISSQLVAISSELDEFMKNADAAAPKCGEKRDEIGPKFLYLNECNLRHEGTLGSSEDSPSRDLINILMDQYEDRDEKNISAETIVKSMKDYWVVTKRSNSRVLFVLINRYATLLEIADEATKLYEQQVKDVFFM